MGASNSRYTALVQTLPSQKGKTFAVTGTTTGTGHIFADTVAQLGADRVLLLNRPSERSVSSFEKLKAAHPETTFVKIDCDLQSFDSVRAACDSVPQHAPDGIDVLCNNAGVMALADQATGDGFDIQMQTNHLSHFLITKRLMPLLTAAADKRGEARVINHSSIARTGDPLQEKYLGKNGGDLGGDDNAMLTKKGGRWTRYQQTKLANYVFTMALHDRLSAKGSNVRALVAHPGVAKTALIGRSAQHGGVSWLSESVLGTMAQSQEDGTCGILRCACDPEVNSGEFYGPGASGSSGAAKLIPAEPQAATEEAKTMLWKASCEAIGEDFDL
eukprot:m.14959 g.14959  ORF g.14959 m.14959 type:complete len:330 (-) comp4933_c0_seq2:47-1036(-)